MSESAPVFPEITVLSHSDTHAELSLFVPEDLHWFKGHFPVQPILPGVVQLDWAVKLAARYLAMDTSNATQIEVLKFQVVIQPGATLLLTLTEKSAQKFTFEYSSQTGSHSSGRVKLT